MFIFGSFGDLKDIDVRVELGAEVGFGVVKYLVRREAVVVLDDESHGGGGTRFEVAVDGGNDPVLEVVG